MKHVSSHGGQVVRNARIEAGLSQQELANRAKCSQQRVSAVEAAADPQWSSIVALLSAMGYELLPAKKAPRAPKNPRLLLPPGEPHHAHHENAPARSLRPCARRLHGRGLHRCGGRRS